MLGKYLAPFFVLVVLLEVTEAMPQPQKGVESTTVKVLMPPSASASFDDEDDAVIIDADNTSPPVDLTPEPFNISDCALPPVKGPCKAIIESWTYNVATASCEKFDWSGCGGNGNRFSEKAFCEKHCSKYGVGNNKKIAAECPKFEGCGPLKCGVSKDEITGCEKCDCNLAGVGNDAVVIVGSVSGNRENPNQQAHVGKKPVVAGGKADQPEKKTVLKPEEVCHLPETRGDCRAMMTRWRYSPEIKECVQFHFGGCDGNPNNFVSSEKCIEFCRGQ
ncbi:protein AMBP [Folsomia candida]|uniref:protein AMBP n=1 Tax=Folsomia candida TaxID=158441 RepID=UPI000B90A106|nr:protein AMBP [Folsomia candida]